MLFQVKSLTKKSNDRELYLQRRFIFYLSLRTPVIGSQNSVDDRKGVWQSLLCCWVDTEIRDRHVALLLAMTVNLSLRTSVAKQSKIWGDQQHWRKQNQVHYMRCRFYSGVIINLWESLRSIV